VRRKIHGAPLPRLSASHVTSSPPCHTSRAHPRLPFPSPAIQIPCLRRQRAPPTSPLPPGAQHAGGSSELCRGPGCACARWRRGGRSMERLLSQVWIPVSRWISRSYKSCPCKLHLLGICCSFAKLACLLSMIRLDCSLSSVYRVVSYFDHVSPCTEACVSPVLKWGKVWIRDLLQI